MMTLEGTELRLAIQFSLPVEDIFEGESLYLQLKEILINIVPTVTMSGQLVKMLEPCCKKAQKGVVDEKIPVPT